MRYQKSKDHFVLKWICHSQHDSEMRIKFGSVVSIWKYTSASAKNLICFSSTVKICWRKWLSVISYDQKIQRFMLLNWVFDFHALWENSSYHFATRSKTLMVLPQSFTPWKYVMMVFILIDFKPIVEKRVRAIERSAIWNTCLHLCANHVHTSRRILLRNWSKYFVYPCI